MENIEKIKELKIKVDKILHSNINIKYIHENLFKIICEIDCIQSKNIYIRLKRKQLINYIQKYLDDIEKLV